MWQGQQKNGAKKERQNDKKSGKKITRVSISGRDTIEFFQLLLFYY